ERGSEAEQERERDEPQEAAAQRERVGERFTQRKKGELETVDEQGEPGDDEQRALEQRKEPRDRLAENDRVEEEDYDDDGRHVAERAENHAPEESHSPPVPMSPSRVSSGHDSAARGPARDSFGREWAATSRSCRQPIVADGVRDAPAVRRSESRS